MAVNWIVSGPVDRTDNPASLVIEKVAGLPVHLDRNMRAPIHVRNDTPVKAQCERARRLTPQLHIEAEGQPALGQRR
jgi:hypothetical protein